MKRIILSICILLLLGGWIYAGFGTGDPANVKATITDPDGYIAEIDNLTQSMRTVGIIHAEVHDGHMYNSSHLWTSLADGATATMLLYVTTTTMHAVFAIACGGDAYIYLYEGANYHSSGTAITPINLNRTTRAGTSIEKTYHSPQGVYGGTLLFNGFIAGGSGSGPQSTASGGNVRMDVEWIFKQNEDYILAVQNVSGDAHPFSIDIEFYEEENY